MGLFLAVPSSENFLSPSQQSVIALLIFPLIADGINKPRYSRRANLLFSPTSDENTNNTRARVKLLCNIFENILLY